MAERKKDLSEIADSDVFMDMPLSAQALYFHLVLRADEKGFLNNPDGIRRGICASVDDINILIMRSFVIPTEDGVNVITDLEEYCKKNYIVPGEGAAAWQISSGLR